MTDEGGFILSLIPDRSGFFPFVLSLISLASFDSFPRGKPFFAFPLGKVWQPDKSGFQHDRYFWIMLYYLPNFFKVFCNSAKAESTLAISALNWLVSRLILVPQAQTK
jgi:hypothetical protein